MELSKENVAFLMEGKFSLRHVSDREHLNSHFEGPTQQGDAFPLSGMGKMILDQMVESGLMTRQERNKPMTEIMEGRHGDTIRDRFELGLTNAVQHCVNWDQIDRYSNASVHFMIVGGMHNADKPVDIGKAYPYGKCGRQTIRSGQILPSMCIDTNDLAGPLAAGKTVTEVFVGKITNSVEGLRTGQPKLVEDLRNNSDNVLSMVAPNSIIYNQVDPLRDPNFRNADNAKGAAMAAWMLEATYATTTVSSASDIARLGKITEAAIKADPMLVLSGSMGLVDFAKNPALAAAAPGWIQNAFTELTARDPEAAMRRAAIMAECLPEGHPQMSMALNSYSNAFDAFSKKDPAGAQADIKYRQDFIKPESSLGKMMAEKQLPTISTPKTPQVSLHRQQRM